MELSVGEGRSSDPLPMTETWCDLRTWMSVKGPGTLCALCVYFGVVSGTLTQLILGVNKELTCLGVHVRVMSSDPDCEPTFCSPVRSTAALPSILYPRPHTGVVSVYMFGPCAGDSVSPWSPA